MFVSDWLTAKSLDPVFETLEEDALNNMLRKFYAELHNQDGKKYSRSALLGIRAAIQRFLTSGAVSRKINIINGEAFKPANEVLVGLLRKLKQDGQDKSKSHPAISEFELAKLYTSGALSDENPISLQNKVFFEVCLHFGRRGREGLRELKKEHFCFVFDEVGVEFVTLCFNPAEKNHQGFNLKDTEHDQRLYGTGAANCPLVSLKKYINLLHPDCPFFFQRPREGDLDGASTWYINSPVGVNKISAFMSRISKQAGLQKTYTNHSIRATTVTSLRKKGVHVNDIMAVTGHKCPQSIMSYSTTTETARRQMSHALSSVAGYNITTASPKKSLKKPSAALGKAPPSLPTRPEVEKICVKVKQALPEVCPVKARVSTPKKERSIALRITPSKHGLGGESDIAMLIKEAMAYDEDDSPNKIPCSQIVKAEKNASVGKSDMSVAKSLFNNATFHGCSFTIVHK